MNKLSIAILSLALTGCATLTSSKLVYTPEVRQQSHADGRLFKDLLSAIGGVGFADEVYYPNAAERKIIKIESIVPYDNQKTGIENWTIDHGDAGIVTYIIKLIPDGQGGTNFSVGKKK
ncbi:MAG TPA: hypothetical protein VL357_11910 [Rariglobus sp.]|nr:hypothetical protein [Rariglobus sp.]